MDDEDNECSDCSEPLDEHCQECGHCNCDGFDCTEEDFNEDDD